MNEGGSGWFRAAFFLSMQTFFRKDAHFSGECGTLLSMRTKTNTYRPTNAPAILWLGSFGCVVETSKQENHDG
jgi:hypothetical protein